MRTWEIKTCDVLDGLRGLPDGSVHCCVTSPPYFALRDYGVDGQIGLESTPEAYVARMVEVFGEVRRVLRDDGTLWLNIGDSWNSGTTSKRNPSKNHGGNGYGKHGYWSNENITRRVSSEDCKPKDLIGIPWLLAFALRADGWYLRSEIIWHKRSPMPESVRDRPTKAHEQIFLLSKSQRYFYDAVASAEKASPLTRCPSKPSVGNKTRAAAEAHKNQPVKEGGVFDAAVPYRPATRNMRSVWTLSSEPFPGAHFATYPTELVRRCLLAGTSEKGCCPECGAPRKRIVEKQQITRERPNAYTKRTGEEGTGNSCANTVAGIETKTIGWKPGCQCVRQPGLGPVEDYNDPSECAIEPMPCLVLDPFTGAGTTCVVARRLGLRFIGFELNPTYAEMARKRVLDDNPLLNAA